jgi:inner membrane protein involved in colicin E2 resistance
MSNYVLKKEQEDQKDEERRKKKLKDRENEMKRILDIQLKERDEKERLKKIEDITEATYIKKDVEAFMTVEERKKKLFDQQVQDHNNRLVQQIQEKHHPKKVEASPEILMNKPLILQIAASKLVM